MPVIDGRHGSPYTRYVPVGNSPHGINGAGQDPRRGGRQAVADRDRARHDPVRDLFDDKIEPRGVVVAEPEIGLGPLHTAYDGRGNAYTTLFLDSQIVKWNIDLARRAFKGEKSTDHPEARRPLPARPQPQLDGPDLGGGRQVAASPEQVLQGPLPQRRPAQARERPADRHLGRRDEAGP